MGRRKNVGDDTTAKGISGTHDMNYGRTSNNWKRRSATNEANHDNTPGGSRSAVSPLPRKRYFCRILHRRISVSMRSSSVSSLA